MDIISNSLSKRNIIHEQDDTSMTYLSANGLMFLNFCDRFGLSFLGAVFGVVKLNKLT